ncbi:MAG: chitinase N-terminal domain-containing protein [Candidatus Binatia bacterium]
MPVITAPTAGLVVNVSGVTFAWNAVAGATSYDVRITNASATTVFSGSLTGNSATSTLISLPQNGSYTVMVRACNGGTCTAFANRAFSVALATPLTAPTIVAPTSGAVLTASLQTLSWTAVTGTPGFLFYVRSSTSPPEPWTCRSPRPTRRCRRRPACAAPAISCRCAPVRWAVGRGARR